MTDPIPEPAPDDSNARRWPRRWIAVAVAAAVVAGVAATASLGPDGSEPGNAEAPLAIKMVSTGDLAMSDRLAGTVQATSELVVVHRISGAPLGTGASAASNGTGGGPALGMISLASLAETAGRSGLLPLLSDPDPNPTDPQPPATQPPVTQPPDQSAATAPTLTMAQTDGGPGTTATSTTDTSTTDTSTTDTSTTVACPDSGPGAVMPDPATTTTTTTDLSAAIDPSTTTTEAPLPTVPTGGSAGTGCPTTTTTGTGSGALPGAGPAAGGGGFTGGGFTSPGFTSGGGSSGLAGATASGATAQATPHELVTSVVAAGAAVASGDVLYSVEGRPVVALTGAIPAWRDLTTSSPDGADVAQLEAALAALGYDDGGAVTVDSHYSAATARAVSAWQEGLGLDATGTVSLGSVVFVPEATTVSGVQAAVGDELTDGDPVLRLATPSQQVVAEVPDELRPVVTPGLPVEVSGVTGTVSRLGSTSGSDGVTVEAVISLPTPIEAAPGSSVSARFTVTDATGVLLVPVDAVTSRIDGTYAVYAVDDSGTAGTWIPVGVHGVANGQVAVTGPGLRGGLAIAVPSSPGS